MDIIKEPYASCTPRLPLDQLSKDHEDLHILLQMRHGTRGHLERLAEYIKVQSSRLRDILLKEFKGIENSTTVDSWQRFWRRVAPISRSPKFHDKTMAYAAEQPFPGLSSDKAAEIQEFLDYTRGDVQTQINLLISSVEDRPDIEALPQLSDERYELQNDPSRKNCSCRYQLGIEHAAREETGHVIKIGLYLNISLQFDGAFPSGNKEVNLRFCFGWYLAPSLENPHESEAGSFASKSIAANSFSTHGSTVHFTNNSVGIKDRTMWSCYLQSLLEQYESKPRPTAISTATLDQRTRESTGSVTPSTI